MNLFPESRALIVGSEDLYIHEGSPVKLQVNTGFSLTYHTSILNFGWSVPSGGQRGTPCLHLLVQEQGGHQLLQPQTH